MFLKGSLWILVTAVVLLAGGLYYHVEFTNKFTESRIALEVQSNLKEALAEIELEANELLKAYPEVKAWESTSNSFLLADSTKIIEWSNTIYLPDISQLANTFKYKYIQSSRGDFILRKWEVSNSRFLIAILPLTERFKVSNKYLKPKWNGSIFPVQGITILEADQIKGTKICVSENECCIKLLMEESELNVPSDSFSIIMILIGLALLLYYLSRILRRMHDKGSYEVVFVYIFLIFFVVRVGMIEVGFPAHWTRFDLFDPQYFASSSFNISLGDLVINSLFVLLCVIYLFANYSKLKTLFWLRHQADSLQSAVGVLALTITFFSFLFPFLFFELIFHNSSISLDITRSIHFDSLRVLAYISVVIGTISSFLVCHVFLKLAILMSNRSAGRFALTMLLASGFYITYCIIESHDYSISFSVSFIYVTIIYFTGWHRTLNAIGFSSFLYVLIAIIAYSAQGSLSIRTFTQERIRASQFRFANNNLINHDNLGEFLLSESIKRIALDAFIQARIDNPFLSKQTIRQRVKQVYFNSYFDRYDLDVLIYNSSGAPLNNYSTKGFASSILSMQNTSLKTDYAGVYRIRDPSIESSMHYVAITPIKRNEILVGYVMLDLKLKRIVPQNLYPELLVDNRFSQFVGNRDFSFAIFSGNDVSNSLGSFNYEKSFDRSLLNDQSLYTTGVASNNLLHVAVHGEDGDRVVVSANEYPIYFVLANWAFLLVLGLGLLLIWIVSYSIRSIIQGFQLKYAARIQLFVYLSILLPLIIVTVSILRLTSMANEEQLLANYELKAKQIAESVISMLEPSQEDSLSATLNWDAYLYELSKSTNTDINIFKPDGFILASNQPTIYETQMKSGLIDRDLFLAFVKDKESYQVVKESIGSLQYNSSYLALRSPISGELVGILNLPFFKSVDVFEENKAVLLANILVIFVLAFISFTIVSYYAVNWLTFPLRLITKVLSRTSLTGVNQPLQWNSQDEIGLMVSEYNRMLLNLEHSKRELFRTQKESAWREMAQQVAHEIKNPLTPMKLTLQQMEINSLGDERKLNSIRMLLQQVEILNDIASSFSTFAKMPTPHLTELNIVKVLENSVQLYVNHPNGKVLLTSDVASLHVMGDTLLLSRVFSNIVLNALQSASPDSKVTLQIRLALVEKKCIIRFIDDGIGMEKDVQERIFTPYFSTKKSGSGLGLAIAKNGIEQCGGKIGFVSEVGKGTEFWIELDSV